MDRVDIRLLGPIEVAVAGVPVGLGPPRQRALLALLALNAGRAVPVSGLIDGLWGDRVPASAIKMVHILVSRLRKVLPPDLLVTRAPGYQLALPRSRVDAFRAEELLREGRDALAEGDSQTASELLSGALALWRGQALAEFDAPFAVAESRRLEELQLALTEERIQAGLDLGRFAEEIGEIETVIARHPLRERPRGQLMLALYGSDRQAEALAAYQETRRTLTDQLGIDPSPALRELERRILCQDPALLPAPAAEQVVPVPTRRPARIVGRAAELAVLDEHLGAVLGGEVRLVLVSGEAGAGKTTLLESFLAGVRAEDRLLVGRGQCVEQHGASEAYMPVLEALDELFHGQEGKSLLRLAVERMPTWIVQMPGSVGTQELERARRRIVGATRERMLREIVEALMAAAADRPIALVLEDLHWSDPSTLVLLSAFALRRDPARLLIIGTLRSADAATRSHPVHAVVADLAPRGLCAHLEVGALDEAGVAEYLDARVPGAALPAALSSALMQRTGGNPLFLEKTLDSWVESGKVRREASGWRVDADPDELARGVPSSVRQLIRQRLMSVEPQDRQILDAASVAAPEFSAALVAAACDRAAEEVEGRCDQLAGDGILLVARGAEAWPDGTIAGRFGFTHDLCHEVLYEDLPPGRRARLHVAAGTRLEAAHGEGAWKIAPALAAHFVRGGDVRRALPHLRVAAAQALERLAPREAIDLLDTGLALLDALPEGRERMEYELVLLNMKGPVLIATQGWASLTAEAAFSRAGQLARSLQRPDDASWSKYKLATLYEVQGDYERSETLLGEVLAEPARRGAGRGPIDSRELLSCMACSLFHQGAFGRALESAERGLDASEDASRDALMAAYGDDPEITCHSWAALSLWHLGRPDEARARARMSVTLSEQARLRHGLATALVLSAIVTQCRREPAETRGLAEAGIEAAARKGFPYRVAMGTAVRGWALAAEGASDEGISELRRGIDLARMTGARMDDTYFLGLLADTLIGAGEHGEGLDVLDEALAAVPRGGRFFYDAELHRLRSEGLRGLGRTDQAEAALWRALRSAREQGGRSLELRCAVSLGSLLGDTGRTGEARALVAAVHGTFEEGFETADLREAAAFLATETTTAPGAPTRPRTIR